MGSKDGGIPGGNGDAKNKAGDNNDDADEIADDKAKKGGDKTGDDDDEKAGQVVFGSQKELDELIAKRLKRDRDKREADEKLTKEQLLEKELNDSKLEVRIRDAKDQFVIDAGLDLAKGSKLFRMYKDDIDFDKDGKPENMSDVIKKAKAEWPELFSGEKQSNKPKGGGDGGGGGGNDEGKPSHGGMNAFIRGAKKKG